MPKDKVIATKIGSESDNYLQYAIKNNRLDLALFFLQLVPEISLLAQNSQNYTAFHLAVKSGQLPLVKLLCISDLENAEALIKTPGLADIKGNMNSDVLVKLMGLKTIKFQTPLMLAVEQGNNETFKFLFELMVHLQKSSKKCQVLTQAFEIKDNKQETVLMKAVIKEQTLMAEIVL